MIAKVGALCFFLTTFMCLHPVLSLSEDFTLGMSIPGVAAPSEGYQIADALVSAPKIFLKKRGEIWSALLTGDKPTRLCLLPAAEVISHSNMLCHNGSLFVAHDRRILAVSTSLGQVSTFADNVDCSQMLGVDGAGGLYAIVVVRFGEVSGSDVKSFIVRYDKHKVAHIWEPEGGASLWSAACDNANNQIAVGMYKKIAVLSSGFETQRVIYTEDGVSSLAFCGSSLLVLEGRDKKGVLSIVEYDGVRTMGEGFSAAACGGANVMALRDDSSAHLFNMNTQSWSPIAEVVGCDNDRVLSSYARTPVVTADGRFAFLSLACHKIEGATKSSSSVMSYVVDTEKKRLYPLGDYFDTACWDETH